MRILPNSLAKVRASKGLTVQKLAYLLNLTTDEYLEYEFGLERSMPKFLIEKISFILYCPITEFAEGYRQADKDFTIFAHAKELVLLKEKYHKKGNVLYIDCKKRFIDLIHD